MIKTFKKINGILSRKDRLIIAGLVVMMFIGGVLELVGVSLILPLMQIIGGGGHIKGKTIIILSLTLIGIYIVKNLYLIFMYRCIFSFVSKGKAKLSTYLMNIYMHEPYEFHLRRNVSIIHRAVVSDTEGVYNVLRDILQMASELIICFLLACALFYTDFWMACYFAILIGISMGIVLYFSKKKLGKLGKIEMECQGKRSQWVFQGIGGIKEIKVLGKEKYFVSKLGEQVNIYAVNNISQQIYIQIPRLLTETICISGVLLYIVICCLLGKDIAVLIPTFAVFGVAAFRLLPSVGKINGYINDYHYFKPRVDFVIDDLNGINPLALNDENNNNNAFDFTDVIKIDNISFSYEGKSECVLEYASLEIEKNKSVAIIGPSGSGKTTLADIIMGLLKPSSGSITVDGKDINDNIGGWYSILGYVPQTIYLSDDTVKRNVAFGLEDDEIDEDRVKDALRKAQLLDFALGLDDGLDTFIGDRGVRLSGGQRQRIGIARALYHNPQILILDEATSSLDNETEAAVMDAIETFKGQITMIIIAHRLSTIENCDEVYRVEGKKCTKIK